MRVPRLIVSSTLLFGAASVLGGACSDETGDKSTTGAPGGTAAATGSGGGGGLGTGGAGQGGLGTGGSGGNPCSGGQMLCNGVCVSTVVDPNNCGGCGVVCAPDEVCLSNGCAAGCPPPLTACAGTCVDTTADGANCGGCGNACPPGEGCVDGSCQPAVVVGPPPDKCADGGPPIVIEGGPEPTCSGAIADSFTYALCACNDVGVPVIGSDTLVDAFDSSAGPYVPNGLGGSVGANGSIQMSSKFWIYGDVRTAAGAGLTVGGDTDVHQSLHVATALAINEVLDVDKDAYVGGPITGSAPATIGGTLHTPSCASVPGSVSAASCAGGAVNVPAPCDCDAADLLPISSIVQYHADPAHNDNALIGLSPSVFDGPGAPGALLLPCGYYYLNQINATGALTIAVQGHTALFIGGSIEVSSPVVFTLSPTSTLDVFVGGTIHATAQLTVGSPAYPSKSRFYVGGVCKAGGGACTLDADCCSLQCSNGTCGAGGGNDPAFSVDITGPSFLNGGFYSPYGVFSTSSDLEMYGALFVGWYDSGAPTKIHYDKAFIKEGKDCPDDEPDSGPDPQPCDGCGDCGFQACINGECGPCTDSSQCCAPLYCVGGECMHVPE